MDVNTTGSHGRSVALDRLGWWERRRNLQQWGMLLSRLRPLQTKAGCCADSQQHHSRYSTCSNEVVSCWISALKRLIATADVVVENFRPDVKFRLGIDYESLCKDHQRLVYASISGFTLVS